MLEKSSSSSSHSLRAILNSAVRDALVASVTCSVPPERFHISHESMVPNASSPRSARARASGTLSSSHRSEEHTSELQSLMRISYAVFCLKKKNKNKTKQHNTIRKNVTQ